MSERPLQAVPNLLRRLHKKAGTQATQADCLPCKQKRGLGPAHRLKRMHLHTVQLGLKKASLAQPVREYAHPRL